MTQEYVITADCCKYDTGTRGSTKCVELLLVKKPLPPLSALLPYSTRH